MKIKTKLKSEKGFYVGDICYVMPDKDYYGSWNNDFKNFEGVHELRGHTFAVAHTAYGDGFYEDQKGRGYGVDAGNIGILPLELCKDDLTLCLQSGTVVFANEAEFEAEDGYMEVSFSNGEEISIDTRDLDEEEDEDEEGGQVFDEDENSGLHQA